MKTITIYKHQFRTLAEYHQAVKDARKMYPNRAAVDDGEGGSGWMFFESPEDYMIWKNHK